MRNSTMEQFDFFNISSYMAILLTVTHKTFKLVYGLDPGFVFGIYMLYQIEIATILEWLILEAPTSIPKLALNYYKNSAKIDFFSRLHLK